MEKVYITKYALTTGIMYRNGEISESRPDVVFIPGNQAECTYGQYFHPNEWHRTWESALKRAEEMRRRKIVSLNKQLTKLHDLKFVHPEEG